MGEGFNTAAAFFFGIGGSVLWVLFGLPYVCVDKLGQVHPLPALAAFFGRTCETKTVLGISPIVASEEGAIILAFLIGGACFVIGGILTSGSSSS